MRLHPLIVMLIVPLMIRAEALKSTAETLEEIAKAAATWVSYFHDRDVLTDWITGAVIFLGAAGTVAALIKVERMKYLTASMSATVALLAGLKAQVLHADQESFGSLSAATSRAVEDIKRDLRNYRSSVQFAVSKGKDDLSEEEANSFAATFKTHRETIERIDARAQKVNVTIMSPRPAAQAQLTLPMLRSVYAASDEPVPPVGMRNLEAMGRATCSTTYGAREYARYEGRRQLALQLFPSPTAERLDSLIMALDGAVSEPSSNVSSAGDMAVHEVRVTLNRAIADKLLQRIKKDNRPPQHFLWSSPVKAGFQGRVDVGVTSKRTGADGAFVFAFDVAHNADSTMVQLAEIRTYDDNSSHSTRWSFDVYADNSRIFSIPMHRFEDSGKPTICRPGKEELAAGSIPWPAGKRDTAFTLSVRGFMPF